MADNLDTALAVNKALKERNRLLRQGSSELRTSVAVAQAMQEALAGASADKLFNQIEETRNALDDAADRAESFGQAASRGAKMSERNLGRVTMTASRLDFIIEEIGKRLGTKLLIIGGVFDGLISGFKFSINVLKSVSKTALGVVDAFYNIGKSIAAIPFKMLSALIENQNRYLGLWEDIARNIETVRMQFGELVSGPGRDVTRMYKNMTGTIEGTGLTAGRVFGFTVDKIQWVLENAKQMGATFELVRREMAQNALTLGAIQKGLGLTGEQMQGLALRATRSGTTITRQTVEMSKYATDFAKRFRVSAKEIGRMMGEMASDFTNFGSLSQKELAITATYTKKLGVETKALLGVIGKYDDFEDAAVNAAKLSQAFGTQVDVMKLVMAQNPADMLDELRKGFFATGKSVEMLTRQERRLLEEQTGLTGANLEAAFSSRNMGVSIEQLRKQGKISEKQQISQAEATLRLADSIERVIKPFRRFTSFFESLISGFMRGINMSKPFIDIMRTLRGALKNTHSAGIQLGKMFAIIAVPMQGLGDIISSVFNPKKFKAFFDDIKRDFKWFFSDMTKSDWSLVTLMDTLQMKFFKHFDPDGEGGSKILSRLDKFTQGFGMFLSNLTRAAAVYLTDFVKALTNFLKGEDLDPKGGQKFIKNIFGPMIKTLKDQWKTLRPALVELIKTSWEKAEPVVKPILHKAAGFIILTMFGAAFIKGVEGAIIGSFKAGIESAFAGKGFAAGAPLLSKIGSAFAPFTAKLGAILFNPVTLAVAAVAAIGAAAVGVSKGMEKYNATFRKEFSKTEAMMGAATAGIVNTITLGLVDDQTSMAIGRWVAGLGETILKGIDNLFGRGVGNAFRKQIEGAAEMMKSLGDLIRAVFSGDTEKLSKTAEEFGQKFTRHILNTIEFHFKTLPKIIIKSIPFVLKALVKGLAWVAKNLIPFMAELSFKMVGAITNALAGVANELATFLQDIPIVGGVVSSTFNMIAAIFSKIGEGFNFAGDVFKYLRNNWDALSIRLGDGILAIHNKIVAWMKRVRHHASEVFSVSNWIGYGKAVIDGLLQGLGDVKKTIGKKFNDVVGGIKEAFGISSPSKEMMNIGNELFRGLKLGLADMPRALSSMAEEGVDRIAANMGKLTKLQIKLPQTADIIPAVRVMKAMIQEVNEVNDQLADLDAVNLEARLERLADKIGLDKKEFTINHENVNVNVNLTVVMEADQLADAIIDTKKVIKA